MILREEWTISRNARGLGMRTLASCAPISPIHFSPSGGNDLFTMLTFLLSSPKDQAILEAEYKQNPKPNKAARAEIVKKVDLNEKEVQVNT